MRDHVQVHFGFLDLLAAERLLFLESALCPARAYQDFGLEVEDAVGGAGHLSADGALDEVHVFALERIDFDEKLFFFLLDAARVEEYLIVLVRLTNPTPMKCKQRLQPRVKMLQSRGWNMLSIPGLEVTGHWKRNRELFSLEPLGLIM